jgi:hypothetical protein
LKKAPTDCKAKLIIAALAIMIVVISFSVVAVMPVTKAQGGGSISVSPNQGPAGTQVSVMGGGFSDAVTITFNGANVGTQYPNEITDTILMQYTIPTLPAGSYHFTATDDAGDSATAAFTVTSGSSSPTSAAPTSPPYLTSTAPPGSSTSNPWLYTYPPTTESSNSGFWTPVTISLIAAAVLAVVLIPSFLFTRRGNGKQRSLYEEERPSSSYPSSSPYSSYTPKQPAQSAGYSPSGRYQSTYQSRSSSTLAASRYSRPQSSGYNKPSSSTYTSTRYSQPSNYSRPTQLTKACPRCGKSVNEDQNICPSCNKRLK